jgi:Flp pilus assembly protein TadG
MMGLLWSRRRRCWRLGDCGAAAIEFACAAPLLTIMLAGTVELGLMVRARLAVEEAVSAGGQWAQKNGFDATKITSAVQSANPGMTVTASPAPSEFYACPNSSGLTTAASSTTCSDGAAARHFVTVRASVSRPSVFGSNFGLPTTLSARTTVRAP